jgi:hypothetical protein
LALKGAAARLELQTWARLALLDEHDLVLVVARAASDAVFVGGVG